MFISINLLAQQDFDGSTVFDLWMGGGMGEAGGVLVFTL